MEHAINYIKKKRGLKSMKIFDNAMHIECKEEIKFLGKPEANKTFNNNNNNIFNYKWALGGGSGYNAYT